MDFLVRTGREIWAIEVKATRRPTAPMRQGLRRVGDRVRGVSRRILLFLGRRAQRIDDIEVVPLEEFLVTLPR